MKSAAATHTRILVIEDEPSVAAFLRAALERRGYEVGASRSASEALELLPAGEFSGVICDLRTPTGTNGADIRSWPHSHQPQLAGHMIFITGDTASPETTTLLERERIPCVEQPFGVHELIAAVEGTIGKP